MSFTNQVILSLIKTKAIKQEQGQGKHGMGEENVSGAPEIKRKNFL